jgi:hypothetical protein
MTIDRSKRFLGMSSFDLFLSMILSSTILTLSNAFINTKRNKPVHYPNLIFFGAFSAIPLGIYFHALFGVDTFLNWKLGLSEKPTAVK